jgi:hypothetical protein
MASDPDPPELDADELADESRESIEIVRSLVLLDCDLPAEEPPLTQPKKRH